MTIIYKNNKEETMTRKSANSKLKNKQETKETNSNQKQSTNKTLINQQHSKKRKC